MATAAAATALLRTRDLYEVLRVPRFSATPVEIRTAYRRRALETHPDKGGSAEAFREVVLAFEALSSLVCLQFHVMCAPSGSKWFLELPAGNVSFPVVNGERSKALLLQTFGCPPCLLVLG